MRRICKDYRPPELINNEGHQHERDERPTIRLPWIPRLTTKLKKVYEKKGFKVVSYSSANLKTLLCKNKDKLIPNSHPGVYKLDCSCGTSYVGETKKKVLTRSLEHQKDAMEGRWEKMGRRSIARTVMADSIGCTRQRFTRNPNTTLGKSLNLLRFSA